jgi:uncharacterized protein
LKLKAFGWGGIIGILGGLVGLGGAEFRLPVLVGLFRYRTLQAIVINLVLSLVTVCVSFAFRAKVVPLDDVIAQLPTIVSILTGSLCGAALGVRITTRVSERHLTRVVIILLVFLSAVLIGHQYVCDCECLHVPEGLRMPLGLLAGVLIGIVSSMLGVAGGELIIPTLILVFLMDIKLAGSLALVVSFPTILVGLFKYYRAGQLSGMSSEEKVIVPMASGSIVGAFVGSSLLHFVSHSFLHVLLGLILLASAIQLYRHTRVKLPARPYDNFLS